MSRAFDETIHRMERATDQLKHGVHKSEIDFKTLSEVGMQALDEIVSKMSVGDKLEFCAGPFCEGCKRDCELAW